MNQLSCLSQFASRLQASMTPLTGESWDAHPLADEDAFNEAALELFALQCRENPAFARLALARHSGPIADWRQIPAAPTAAFKELDLTAIPASQRTRVFRSSGTAGQRPSRHYHHAESLAIYEASAQSWFERHVPNSPECEWIVLTPPPDQAPHSSLVHMFETLRPRRASAAARYGGKLAADGQSWDLDLPRFQRALEQAGGAGRPGGLLGTAFAFVQWLDRAPAPNRQVQLPEGSFLLETGGYKGRSRHLSRPEFHSALQSAFGLPPHRLVGEYGMAELSVQAYDLTLNAGPPPNRSPQRRFQFPPWARAIILSPESGRPVAPNASGLLRVIDLANVWSALAVQTDDLAASEPGGFTLLGRSPLAEPRGCSLKSLP